MTQVAVVLVTHNAEAWIGQTLDSIARQTQSPVRVVVVDDFSTDGTQALLAASDVTVVESTATSTDVTTRIAQNFVQGVRGCGAVALVALGDHDDVWHADRIAAQAALLDAQPTAAMVASDGVVIDEAGTPTGATLRQAFPVPDTWDRMTPVDRMRHALRRSIATGGASMIRPAAFPALDVPAGWLHDRWWSLVATARDAMLIDAATVIDYRVQPSQRLGLDQGAQQFSGLRRVVALASSGPQSFRKYRDLRGRLRPLAVSPEIANAIRPSSIR